MTDPGWALQKAFYAALTASLSVPVYDEPPQGAAYPYVTLNSQAARPDDPLDSRRDERLVYLTVWSSYRGQREVLEIMGALDAVLHRARLPLETGRMIRAYVVRKITSRDLPDGTYSGSVTVRVLVEH